MSEGEDGTWMVWNKETIDQFHEIRYSDEAVLRKSFDHFH